MTPQMGLPENYSNSTAAGEKTKVVGANLKTEIREFLKQKFPLARKRQIQDSDALLESGMLDSQGILEVVAFIEKEFSIVIADDDLIPDNFQSIEQIASFVQQKVGGAA